MIAGSKPCLARRYGGAGRAADAIAQLRRTAARRAALSAGVPGTRRSACQGRTVDEAIAVVESALALAPESIDLQLDLARLHFHRNERGKARAILVGGARCRAGRPDILTELARVLLWTATMPLPRTPTGMRWGCVLTMPYARQSRRMPAGNGRARGGEAKLRSAVRGRPQMLGRSDLCARRLVARPLLLPSERARKIPAACERSAELRPEFAPIEPGLARIAS